MSKHVSQCRNWPSDDYAWTRKDTHAAITQCHNGPRMSMHGHRTQWSSSAAIGPWMSYTPTTKLSRRLDSTHGFEGGGVGFGSGLKFGHRIGLVKLDRDPLDRLWL